MYHAVQAGECCAITLITVPIQLLLGENISTSLQRIVLEVLQAERELVVAARAFVPTSQEKETIFFEFSFAIVHFECGVLQIYFVVIENWRIAATINYIIGKSLFLLNVWSEGIAVRG